LSTLGIDLGGTKILAAVVEDGRVLDRVRVDTPQTGFDAVVAAMAGAARELIGRGYQVTGVGVGSPGPLDHERGRVVFAPNIAGMVDAPLVEALEQQYDELQATGRPDVPSADEIGEAVEQFLAEQDEKGE